MECELCIKSTMINVCFFSPEGVQNLGGTHKCEQIMTRQWIGLQSKQEQSSVGMTKRIGGGDCGIIEEVTFDLS